MATQLETADNAERLDVSPLTVNFQVTDRQYIDIRLTALNYEVTYSKEGIVTFDKASETLIAIEQGTTEVTITAGNLSKTIVVSVSEKVTETTENLTLSKISDYQSEVRLIQDGKDLVDSECTNRPHKDIMSNIDKILAVEDTKAFQSLGNWRNQVSYKTGDIVSFLTNLYKSKTDNNRGNTPLPPTIDDEDEFWEHISPISKIQLKDYSITERLENSGDDHDTVHPVSNGKPLRKFKIQANTIYTMLKISKLWPVKERYGLYLDFSKYNTDSNLESDFRYPKISYVEFELRYKGFKYNRSNTLLPELNITECYCSSYDRALTIPYLKQDGSGTYYDSFGAYGLSLQVSLRRDGVITVDLITKYDCELSLTGEYTLTPYFDDVLSLDSYNSKIFTINHIIRPGGGDQAFKDIGRVVCYDRSMNVKQQWDRGIVNRTKQVTLSLAEYSLLAMAVGQNINYKDKRPTDVPLDVPSSSSGEITLPALSNSLYIDTNNANHYKGEPVTNSFLTQNTTSGIQVINGTYYSVVC